MSSKPVGKKEKITKITQTKILIRRKEEDFQEAVKRKTTLKGRSNQRKGGTLLRPHHEE